MALSLTSSLRLNFLGFVSLLLHTAPSLFHSGLHFSPCSVYPLNTLRFYIPFLQLFKLGNTVFEQYLPCRSEAPPHSMCDSQKKKHIHKDRPEQSNKAFQKMRFHLEKLCYPVASLWLKSCHHSSKLSLNTKSE